MKTGKGLVKYAKAQLGKPYWWGTFGQVASQSLLNAQRRMYPDCYTAGDFPRQFGQKVHDCCGLIKGYRWCDTPDSSPRYDGSQDVSAAGLFRQCSRYGSIGTMPDVPGVCVFRSDLGHVGVYIGGGKVIEAIGHAYGVVETDLHRRNWSLWGMPNWIDYDSEDTDEDYTPDEVPAVPQSIRPTYYYDVRMPLLKFGMIDQATLTARIMLAEKGFKADTSDVRGLMDEPTVAAVKEFQRSCRLLADGEIGGDTWHKLLR